MAGHFSPIETLELMLRHLGITFEIQEEDRPMGPTLNVLTGEPERLIGPNGKALEDLQYLLNRALNNGEEEETGQRVLIDVDGYRLKQFEAMMAEVDAIIRQVKENGGEEELPPLNAFDRRLVHNKYADDPDIETISPSGDSRLKRITVRRKE